MCTVEEDARASARHWHTERGQSASVSVSVSAEGCRRDCKFPTRNCKSSPSQRAATRRFLAGIAAGAGAKPFRGGQICSPAGLQSLGRSPRGSEQAREAASSRALSSDGRATESLGSLSTACDLLPDLAQGLQIGARETAILPEEAARDGLHRRRAIRRQCVPLFFTHHTLSERARGWGRLLPTALSS